MPTDRRLVVLDFDDTLVSTAFLYVEAEGRFADVMASLGFDRQEALDRFRAHDAQQAEMHGFAHRSRFPLSMEETLRAMWPQPHHPGGCCHPEPMRWMIRAVRSIGYSVFRRHSRLKPDCHEALGSFIQFDYELRLLTMGDHQVQNKRIDQAGIRHYFDAILVVPRKDVETLRMATSGRADCWVVGDSDRSDIRPAKELGLRAVKVGETPRWGYDAIAEHGGYYATPTLLGAVNIILYEDGLI